MIVERDVIVLVAADLARRIIEPAISSPAPAVPRRAGGRSCETARAPSRISSSTVAAPIGRRGARASPSVAWC